ncbi:MAG: xylulokinase, partial [Primorskyibacter sp.]
DWSEALLEHGGMTRAQMPRLVEGSAPAASLRADLAHAWGLSGDVVVAGGAGDNAAAACGVGALSEGQGFVSLGTSGVLLAARDTCAPDPATAVHTFCHAVPNRWYQMGVILAATDCLNWLARQTGSTPAALSAQLGDELSAPGDLRFLPYLSGERTPHNDAAIRGAFLGLDIAHTPTDLTRAVLEGVSFALHDSLSALRATGARIDRLIVLGGGSQSDLWVHMLATVLNLPLDLPAQGEFGAAMGAARLARCAATGADPEQVMSPPTIARTITPCADLVPAFAQARTAWARIYPALKDLA